MYIVFHEIKISLCRNFNILIGSFICLIYYYSSKQVPDNQFWKCRKQKCHKNAGLKRNSECEILVSWRGYFNTLLLYPKKEKKYLIDIIKISEIKV